MKQDPYKTLGIDKEATQEDIKAAYKKRAAETHPDATGGDSDAFLVVKSAYDILGDPEQREYYDEHGRSKEEITEQDLAEKLVSVAINKAIVRESFKPKSMNLLERAAAIVRNSITDRVNHLNSEKSRLKRHRHKFQEAASRLESKNQDMHVICIIEASIKTLSENISSIEREVDLEERVGEMAVSMIEGYDYQFEESEQRSRSDWEAAGFFTNA